MKKKKEVKARDFNKLLHIKGEINLSTRSESLEVKKYSRKQKHKGREYSRVKSVLL